MSLSSPRAILTLLERSRSGMEGDSGSACIELGSLRGLKMWIRCLRQLVRKIFASPSYQNGSKKTQNGKKIFTFSVKIFL